MGCASSNPVSTVNEEVIPARLPPADTNRKSRRLTLPTQHEPLTLVSPVADSLQSASVATETTEVKTVEVKSSQIQNEVLSLVNAAAKNGIRAVLALMEENSTNVDYQIWCSDAITSLSAGKEDIRVQCKELGGIELLIKACKSFSWNEDVQTKALWAFANLAATWASYLGEVGVVDLVIDSLARLGPTQYQISIAGLRSLTNLCSVKENRERAMQKNATSVISSIMMAYEDDGQLQWRASSLLALLETDSKVAPTASVDPAPPVTEASPATESTVVQVVETEAATSDPEPSQTVSSPPEQVEPVPAVLPIATSSEELTPAAAKVAELLKTGGITAIGDELKKQVELEKPELQDAALISWCFDAIGTSAVANDEAKSQLASGGYVSTIVTLLESHIWEEEVVYKGFSALLALVPDYSALVGDNGGISAICSAMVKHKNHHMIQVNGVKLISLLTLDPVGENVSRANTADAVSVIKGALLNFASDAQLQYRGVNLLERLTPGATESMPRQALIRSQSMRTDELVAALSPLARPPSFRLSAPSPTLPARTPFNSLRVSSLSREVSLGSDVPPVQVQPGTPLNLSKLQEALKIEEEHQAAVDSDLESLEGGPDEVELE
jgi:Armadillo/beta-catenin-like repeat